MANTYTQIYLHVVFAVAGRACAIPAGRREQLQKYMTGIVTRKSQKLIAINESENLIRVAPMELHAFSVNSYIHYTHNGALVRRGGQTTNNPRRADSHRLRAISHSITSADAHARTRYRY
jgi:hypothetical protein